ncbi:MAG: hypothetical protein ACLSBB_17325, partial [Ruthenibacterium lactatiformans]
FTAFLIGNNHNNLDRYEQSFCHIRRPGTVLPQQIRRFLASPDDAGLKGFQNEKPCGRQLMLKSPKMTVLPLRGKSTAKE